MRLWHDRAVFKAGGTVEAEGLRTPKVPPKRDRVSPSFALAAVLWGAAACGVAGRATTPSNGGAPGSTEGMGGAAGAGGRSVVTDGGLDAPGGAASVADAATEVGIDTGAGGVGGCTLYGTATGLYMDGQAPGAPISQAQARSRLQLLAPHTQWLRFYSSLSGYTEAACIAKNELGKKIG